MSIALIILALVGFLLLLLSPVSFIGARHKLATSISAMAVVIEAYAQEEKDSDGDSVTRHYNRISVRNRSGQELSTFLIQGRRRAGERYLLLYNPTTPPKDALHVMNLSLAAIWLGPVILLFSGLLFFLTSTLIYFFA